nr:tail fiber protein [uncultured Roseateles sp.]
MNTPAPTFFAMRGALALAAVCLLPAAPAVAGDEPILGEIMCGAWNFAPRGWALAQGQVLSISQNTALFSLLGTTYGGDGRSTFALPDLRGRAAINAGQGPGLSEYVLGQLGGAETTSLQASHLPTHSHQVVPLGSTQDASLQSPAGAVPASKARSQFFAAATPGAARAASRTDSAGQGQPINIMQPYLVMNCVIATQGVFPSRP